MTVLAQARSVPARTDMGSRHPPPPRWRVVASIAAGETRRMVVHPVLWVGIAVSILAFLGDPMTWAGQGRLVARTASGLGFFLTPMTLALVVVAHAAASRDARHDVASATEATATSPVVRRLGVALGLAGPAVAALALVLGLTTWMRLSGAIGWLDPFDVAGLVAWVLLGGLVGIAASRLGRKPVVGALVAAALAVGAFFLSAVQSPVSRLNPASDWPVAVIEWAPRSPGMHLLWVVGLCLLLLAFIVAADSNVRAGMTVGLLGLVTAAMAASALTSPWTPARSDLFVTANTDPEAASECRELSDLVVWCAPSGRYDAWADEWVWVTDRLSRQVSGVATMPSQRFQLVGRPGLRSTLPNTVWSDPRWQESVHLEPGVVAVPADDGAPTLESVGSMVAALLIDPGADQSWSLAAVDDPNLPEDETLADIGVCTFGDQARGALILAVASVAANRPIDTTNLGYRLDDVVVGADLRVGEVNPLGTMTIMIDDISVDLPPETLHVAASLAGRPGVVLSRLVQDPKWLDPTTSLDELVTTLDLPSPPTLRSALVDAGVPADHTDLDRVVADHPGWWGVVPCP